MPDNTITETELREAFRNIGSWNLVSDDGDCVDVDRAIEAILAGDVDPKAAESRRTFGMSRAERLVAAAILLDGPWWITPAQ